MDAWRTFAGQLIERSIHEARSTCRKLVERSPPLREVVPRCLRFSPAALQQALLVSPLTATLNKVRRLTSYAAEEPHPLLSHPLLHRVLSACTPRALGRLALASSECAERVGHHLSKPDAWAEFAAAKAKATPDLLELLIGATLRLEPAAMVSRLQSCFKAFDAYDLAAESESGGVRVTLALSQLETSVLAEVGTHRPWMWIDDEGVADACPELLGRCVLASLKRKKFSADDLAACFVAWHAPEGYERWSDWCTDQEAFYDAIGRFCEAADLPGAVVEYDSDDEGSVAEDEAMEDEATEVKTEADLDPGEEEADYQYMETDSLWARLVTAEAVHSAITRPFFKAAVDDAYALSGVAFALATHRWRIANLCADLH